MTRLDLTNRTSKGQNQKGKKRHTSEVSTWRKPRGRLHPPGTTPALLPWDHNEHGPSEILKEGGPAAECAGGFTCAVERSWLSPYHQGYVLWGDFPGGSVAETLCSQCRGPGFDPWSYMPPLKISHTKRKTEDPTCPT